jgi:hypothetical protein
MASRTKLLPVTLETNGEGTNVVLLDPDVAAKFPTSQAVNEALRRLVEHDGV